MSFSFEIELTNTKSPKKPKFDWYWAPIFCAFWYAIFYAAVIPSFHSYPKVLSISEEPSNPDKFIGERAEAQLLGLANIGLKLTGTPENEVIAVQYLLTQIDTIKRNARLDLYVFDVELQFSSGEFMLWGMPTLYHNVQNIIVKIGPKDSNSTSYLLVNSHFDSEIGSPGAGDAGVMIATMLETLRVISVSETPLKNPVVFLLNGAEELNLMGAHGFITQHRWAEHAKGLINLDSAGCGGREVLFQSGPNHPWLTKYYGQSVPHPYASTLAEELFQNDFIPSDSDFRIFRDHKGVPGLDMAHTANGYVYHTKYDRFSNLPRGTYQTTGDNILALTRALANAYELEEPEKYAEGHTIFYDYLGWFTVYYTEGAGIAINITVSVAALISIAVSFWMIIRQEEHEAKPCGIRFLQICGVQLLTVVVAVGLTILIGVFVDAIGLSLSWYKAPWMIFGLYFCPMFCALGILPAIYLGWTKQNTAMSLRNSVQLFMHSHAVILVFVTLLLTGMGIRSAFLPMIAVFFYTIGVILGLLVTLIFKNKSLWLPIHLVCQLFPFWFYTYMTYSFFTVFNAMQGRNGPSSNPELFISGVTAIMCIHFAGFIIPILHFFRKPKMLLSVFAILTVIFIIIAATPAAFPFQKDVAAKRFYVIPTNRVFHQFDGQVVRNESGIYVQPVDPRTDKIDDTVYKNSKPQSYTNENCATELNCGLPLYNSRFLDWIHSSRWIPTDTLYLPETTELKLTSKTLLNSTFIRYNFTLNGPDRMTMYIEPEAGVEVTDWSFNRTPLEEKFKTPYFMYITYTVERRGLDFWIELKRNKEQWEGPTFRLAVSGHLVYHKNYYTAEFQEYLKTFPGWVYPSTWLASHESWYF